MEFNKGANPLILDTFILHYYSHTVCAYLMAYILENCVGSVLGSPKNILLRNLGNNFFLGGAREYYVRVLAC